MRVVKYQRISTHHGEVENQSKSIDDMILRMGWNIVGEYKETISGTKSRDTRPQLRKLLGDARKRKFDQVIVYSLCRLGRSTVDVINTIHELKEVGVHIFIVKGGVDSRTTAGEMFMNICATFVSMERDMIVSRQNEAIKRLRNKGNQKWGNGTLMSQETKEKIISLRDTGLSYRGICKEIGVSLGSVQRTLREVA